MKLRVPRPLVKAPEPLRINQGPLPVQAEPPSVPACVRTIIRRLGRPLNVVTRSGDGGKRVTGADLTYPLSLKKQRILDALADLPQVERIHRNTAAWGYTHTALWQYLGPTFRLRIRLLKYEHEIMLVLNSLWLTPEEDAEEDRKEAERQQREAERAAEREKREAERQALVDAAVDANTIQPRQRRFKLRRT